MVKLEYLVPRGSIVLKVHHHRRTVPQELLLIPLDLRKKKNAYHVLKECIVKMPDSRNLPGSVNLVITVVEDLIVQSLMIRLMVDLVHQVIIVLWVLLNLFPVR